MVSSSMENRPDDGHSNYAYLSSGTRQHVVSVDFMRLNQIFATLAIVYLTE